MDSTLSLKCLPEKHLCHRRVILAFQFTVIMNNIVQTRKYPENSQYKEKLCK